LQGEAEGKKCHILILRSLCVNYYGKVTTKGGITTHVPRTRVNLVFVTLNLLLDQLLFIRREASLYYLLHNNPYTVRKSYCYATTESSETLAEGLPVAVSLLASIRHQAERGRGFGWWRT
jgi:hypothetical protein